MYDMLNKVCITEAVEILGFVFKRNAKAFSLSAIVDVLRRRHGMIWGNISETTRAGNFKIYQHAALNTLNLSTGNDVAIYFQSAANCINLFILGSRSGRNFSITVSSISKRFTALEMAIQVLHFLL